jgi:serine phosphatase RsbU (regulator of sigma subunit)
MKLEEKLHEVEMLSEKALEQERHSAELQLQKEKESAKAIEAELRTQAAELQAKAAELQAQALEAENNRRAAELDSARKLQLSMLPARPPEFEGYEIATFIRTASEVGGDYYDFSKKADDELLLCIGDATGHGARAGVMVTIAKSVFVSLAGNISLARFPETLSNAIKEMKLGNLFLCLLTGHLKNGRFSFVSAGMPPVLIYRAETGSVETIGSKAMPLGAPGNFPYEENSITLAPGDTILLMSDGLIEMFNGQKEMFGMKRVHAAFAESAGQDAETIAALLAENITLWRRDQPLEDDVTLLVIRRE